ncbi:SCO4225 family membrane protein [Streptomyces althioticus]|uniref:SCO4225 family membrane protein n=1 Tax=Streptomyces althioticus TaxID=83380 RepID=UPI0036CFB9A9
MITNPYRLQEGPSMPTSDHFRPRRLLALATDSLPARAYLGLVAVGVAAMFLAPDSPIAMAPMMLTAPLSFLPIFVPVGDGVAGGGAAEVAAAVVFVGWMLLCALANAAALGALIRRPDRTPDHRPDRPPVQAPPARPRRALLAAAVDNWPARIYVAVVAAALGTFLYAVLLSPDPGFAGIWPLLAAAPLSFLAAAVSAPAEYATPWLGTLVFSAGMVLAGLVNAVLIGRLTRRIGSAPTRG